MNSNDNVTPDRDRRGNHFVKDAAHLLDKLSTLDDLDDPVLRHAVPLGNGRDKVIGAWTVDDWNAATVERYRDAAEFDKTAAGIMARMLDAGVATTGELFTPRNSAGTPKGAKP